MAINKNMVMLFLCIFFKCTIFCCEAAQDEERQQVHLNRAPRVDQDEEEVNRVMRFLRVLVVPAWLRGGVVTKATLAGMQRELRRHHETNVAGLSAHLSERIAKNTEILRNSNLGLKAIQASVKEIQEKQIEASRAQGQAEEALKIIKQKCVKSDESLSSVEQALGEMQKQSEANNKGVSELCERAGTIERRFAEILEYIAGNKQLAHEVGREEGSLRRSLGESTRLSYTLAALMFKSLPDEEQRLYAQQYNLHEIPEFDFERDGAGERRLLTRQEQ